MVRLVERITREDILSIARGDESPLPKLRDYIYKSTKHQVRGADEATIQDLTQNALLQIIQRSSEYKPEYAASTFIGLVTRRCVQEWVQSRWKRKAITNLGYRREEEQNNAESVNDRMNRWNRYSPIDQLIDQEESEMRRNDIEERTRQLRRFLGEHNYQELFEHYGLGVPQQSIAFTRKVPLGTIKSRLHRAKKSAKSRFE